MGELEKRIILMVGKGVLSPERIEYLGRVNDMLIEAKEEFPILHPKCYYYPPYPIMTHDGDNLEYYKNQMINMHKWFKKWFGDLNG